MSESGVVELVKQRYGQLTEAQCLVAGYVVRHIDDIAFMTVEELAAAAGVSPATVVRFAAELGFSGYTELNDEVRRHVRQHLGPRRGVEAPLEASTPRGAFRAALQRDQEILGTLAARAEHAGLVPAVERLLTARRVRIAGYRTALSAATLLAWGLQLIRGDVELLPAEAELPERLLDMTSDDVLVAFSFVRYYRGTIRVVRLAAERRVPIVVITDSPLSPAARLTDSVIVVPYTSRGIPGFTIVGLIGVVNGLLAAVVASMSSVQQARMVKRIEEAEAVEASWSFWDIGTPAGRST